MFNNLPPELLLKSRTVQSLIWTDLILKDEGRARSAFQKLAEDPQKGKNITGIYIRSALTEEDSSAGSKADSGGEELDREEEPLGSNVLQTLEAIVCLGYLPNLQRQEIHLGGDDWVLDSHDGDIRDPPYPGLQLSFWDALKAHSPQLRTLALTGLKTEDLYGFHLDDDDFSLILGGMFEF
ncbi:hypothetical protein FA15DRAFT_65455 [Coprinopsis marcescibilis]|uniref:Uncharacterized protein n=1 Tax=Coprinopsis marcescibilis TaxID=230819 RepID=A0A5C3KNB2_COPMA|nr:hypothetical protein FA15DRAFT_65455 [Coprinopsis marcescibilis]